MPAMWPSPPCPITRLMAPRLLHGWQLPHNAPRSAGRRRAAARSVVSSAAGGATGEGTGYCSKRPEYPHFNTLSLGVRSECPEGPGCGRLPASGGPAQRLARVCAGPAVTPLCRPRHHHGWGGQLRARPTVVSGQESRLVCGPRRPADAGDEYAVRQSA